MIFIVDNAGQKKLIPKSDTYDFWKEEIKVRIVEPEKADCGFYLEEYPNEYCYIAREYRNNKNKEDAISYIVLQMCH